MRPVRRSASAGDRRSATRAATLPCRRRSRKTGEEGYATVHAKSQQAFKLNWGTRDLMTHIERAFKGRFIMPDGGPHGSTHPAFLRKIGADQDLT